MKHRRHLRTKYFFDSGKTKRAYNKIQNEEMDWNTDYVHWLEDKIINPYQDSGNKNIINPVKKLFLQGKNIIVGHFNYFMGKLGFMDKKKVLGAKRLAVCDSCIFLDTKSRRCTECGCPVDKKTMATDDKCPKRFW